MVKAESETMTQSLSKLMKAYESVEQTEAVKASMFIRAFNAGKEAWKMAQKIVFRRNRYNRQSNGGGRSWGSFRSDAEMDGKTFITH